MSAQSPRSSSRLPTTRAKTPMYEHDVMRLQRTLDTESLRFEQECKRDVLLNEQIRIMEEELRRKKESSAILLTASADEKKLKQKIAALSHELHLTAISVAETHTENDKLKSKIGSYRRDLCNFQHAIESLSSDIHNTSRVATFLNTENCDQSIAILRQRARFEQVRCKSVNSRLQQNARIRDLSVTPTQATVTRDTQVQRTFVTSFVEEELPVRRNFDLVDPIPIQRVLINRWHDVGVTQKVVAAKHELDRYIKHVKQLEESFRTLQSAIGTSELEEVVSLMIKSQEQNYNQYRQANFLNAEAEMLQEELSQTKALIATLNFAHHHTEQEAAAIIDQLTGRTADLRTSISAKSTHFAEVVSHLSESFVAISVRGTQDLLSLLSVKELRGTFHDGKLTESNVIGYLADAEAGLLALLSRQTHATYSGLVSDTILSKISEKRFDLSPLSVKSTFADSVVIDDDLDEAKTPLRECEFRQRIHKRLLRLPPDRRATRTPL